ncbi:MAG: hypothetical protein LBT59_27990 [Clostridiales bacterium]|jgi:hypothetical protein|nr:hypothetical protein [Clostridiales bacterium]
MAELESDRFKKAQEEKKEALAKLYNNDILLFMKTIKVLRIETELSDEKTKLINEKAILYNKQRKIYEEQTTMY